jgi:hypothetical protein
LYEIVKEKARRDGNGIFRGCVKNIRGEAGRGARRLPGLGLYGGIPAKAGIQKRIFQRVASLAHGLKPPI